MMASTVKNGNDRLRKGNRLRRPLRTNIFILFAGREVRIEKNCARGLEYGPRPQAEGRAQDRGHSFSQYGPTKAGK